MATTRAGDTGVEEGLLDQRGCDRQRASGEHEAGAARTVREDQAQDRERRGHDGEQLARGEDGADRHGPAQQRGEQTGDPAGSRAGGVDRAREQRDPDDQRDGGERPQRTDAAFTTEHRELEQQDEEWRPVHPVGAVQRAVARRANAARCRRGRPRPCRAASTGTAPAAPGRPGGSRRAPTRCADVRTPAPNRRRTSARGGSRFSFARRRPRRVERHLRHAASLPLVVSATDASSGRAVPRDARPPADSQPPRGGRLEPGQGACESQRRQADEHAGQVVGHVVPAEVDGGGGGQREQEPQPDPQAPAQPQEVRRDRGGEDDRGVQGAEGRDALVRAVRHRVAEELEALAEQDALQVAHVGMRQVGELARRVVDRPAVGSSR